MLRHIAAILFLAGWIAPSVQPGRCIALGASEPLNQYWCRCYIYLVDCGWFSQSFILRYSLNPYTGSSTNGGPWIPGYVLTAVVAIIGIAGCYWQRAHKFALPLCALVRPFLVSWAFASFVFDQSVWHTVFLLGVYVAYFVIAQYCKLRIRAIARESVSSVLLGLSIMFFPVWFIALCFVQSTIPFIGLGCTMVACFLLVFAKLGPCLTKASS